MPSPPPVGGRRRASTLPVALVALTLLGGLTACVPAAADVGAASSPPASANGAPAPAAEWATAASGVAASATPATPSAAPTTAAGRPPRRAAPVLTTFAVVGDSITAGGEVIDGPAVPGAASWVPAADAVAGLQLADGWAVPGAKTTDMLAGVGPMAADVLVVMAGTNDLLAARPWEESSAALEGIVATVGARRVVVVAIAPSDEVTAARQQYDAALAQLAAARGWTYVDPWGAADAGDGTWVPGSSADGRHPEAAVAAEAGRRIGVVLDALR